MGGAARFVRTLIPRGRYLPFGSCPCRSRGFDIWRPPAVQGHGGFATPTADAAPPLDFETVAPARVLTATSAVIPGRGREAANPESMNTGGSGWQERRGKHPGDPCSWMPGSPLRGAPEGRLKLGDNLLIA